MGTTIIMIIIIIIVIVIIMLKRKGLLGVKASFFRRTFCKNFLRSLSNKIIGVIRFWAWMFCSRNG